MCELGRYDLVTWYAPVRNTLNRAKGFELHHGLIDITAFLGALLLLLVATRIGAEIAERCGQPSVLGEIFAGILIGATGFGLIVRGFEGNEHFFRVFALSGESAQGTYQALDALAEIGAILLLFEIGLHTDLYELRKVGASALSVGAAGVVLPFFGGWAAARYLLDMAPFTSLIIGAALTATSIGITARVFQDLQMLRTRESQIVLGAAVADDVIGLVILAVLSALGANVESGGNIWIMAAQVTLLAVGFLVAAVVIGVRCISFIDRVLAQMKSRGALTVVAFSFCLLIALLGHEVKLAFIIGAFAAGLVLSHCNRQQELQLAIRPLADLFIPIFFAMMGTVVNLRTMFSSPDVLRIAVVLVVVGVAGKMFGALVVRDRNLNRWIVALGMIPRGEVGLIYARLGIQNDWLRAATYDGVVLMVIVTTVMTPPLLRLAAKRQSNEQAEDDEFSRDEWEVFDADAMMQPPEKK